MSALVRDAVYRCTGPESVNWMRRPATRGCPSFQPEAQVLTFARNHRFPVYQPHSMEAMIRRSIQSNRRLRIVLSNSVNQLVCPISLLYSRIKFTNLLRKIICLFLQPVDLEYRLPLDFAIAVVVRLHSATVCCFLQ